MNYGASDVVQPTECWLSMQDPLGSVPGLHDLGVLVHSTTSSAEGRRKDQEFKAILGYIVNLDAQPGLHESYVKKEN